MDNILLCKEESDTYIVVDKSLLNSKLYSSSEKLLLLLLLGNNKASISVLSKQMGVSKQTICRNLKNLENKGIIDKNRRKAVDGGNISNEYIVWDYHEIWKSQTLDDLKENIKNKRGRLC